MDRWFSVFTVLGVLCFSGCRDGASSGNHRVQDLAREASQAFAERDYREARTLSQEVVHLKPDFAEAWVLHGESSALLGDTASARTSYERAQQLHAQRYRANPDDTNQLVQQIHVLLLLGRDMEARVLLAQGLEAHPVDGPLTRLSLGIDELLVDPEWQRLRVTQ